MLIHPLYLLMLLSAGKYPEKKKISIASKPGFSWCTPFNNKGRAIKAMFSKIFPQHDCLV